MRDDFTARTKIILAQRVAYKCSNPNCRILTVGPNSSGDKSTIIGVAAHITAAAAGGPRFDSKMDNDERRNISNGIWLCENCASIIDKDPHRFEVKTLNKWKEESEQLTWEELTFAGTIGGQVASPNTIPRLELDLIWSGAGKFNRGVDIMRTKEIYGNKPISPMQALWINDIFWNFSISIYNNSSFPAFNIRIRSINGQEFFSYIDKLPKVNNLAPLANTDLDAKFTKHFTGTGKDAIKQFSGKYVPDELIGQTFNVEYLDEQGTAHTVKVIFTDKGFVNEYQEKS